MKAHKSFGATLALKKIQSICVLFFCFVCVIHCKSASLARSSLVALSSTSSSSSLTSSYLSSSHRCHLFTMRTKVMILRYTAITARAKLVKNSQENNEGKRESKAWRRKGAIWAASEETQGIELQLKRGWWGKVRLETTFVGNNDESYLYYNTRLNIQTDSK